MDTTSGYSRARSNSPHGTRSTTAPLPAAASASLVHPVAVRPDAALPFAARPVVSPAGGLSSSLRASGGAVAEAVAPIALRAILNPPSAAASAGAPASAPQEQASTKPKRDEASKEERDIEAEAFAYAKQKPNEALRKYSARGWDQIDVKFFLTLAAIAVEADWTALAQVPASLRVPDLWLLALRQSEQALDLAPPWMHAQLRQRLAKADELLS